MLGLKKIKVPVRYSRGQRKALIIEPKSPSSKKEGTESKSLKVISPFVIIAT